MDPLLNPVYPKPPVREATLEEVRQGLLNDASRPDISWRTAQHYRQLAALIEDRANKAA